MRQLENRKEGDQAQKGIVEPSGMQEQLKREVGDVAGLFRSIDAVVAKEDGSVREVNDAIARSSRAKCRWHALFLAIGILLTASIVIGTVIGVVNGTRK